MPYGTVNADVIQTSTSGGILGAGNASIMKNRIINGAMVIDQRNAGASVTPSADPTYTLDRWVCQLSQVSKFSVQQNAGSVTPPVGFSNYLGITVGVSANVTVGASDYFLVQQKIEGFNTSDLGFGTANAKTVTLSFWVRSSLTGTFGGSLRNSAENRSYPFNYTISAANTWEQKSVTIAGDTTGTWIGATNGIGLEVAWSLGVGSTYSGTAGAWAGANYANATGSVNLITTNSATLYITGVQLEVGSSATGFEYRLYNQELSACQRYFIEMAAQTNVFQSICFGSMYSLTGGSYVIYLPVPMRTVPSLTTAQTLFMQNANINVSSFAGPYSQVGSILEGDFALASNWTSGSVGLIRYNNQSGTKKFSLSAEL
jgi:hypothetical protein